MTTMTRELYDVAVAIASDWRGGYLPKPYRLTGQPPHVLPKRSKAVYIAVDGAGVIRYVGSVSRTRSTAVRERTDVRDIGLILLRATSANLALGVKRGTPHLPATCCGGVKGVL